MITNPGFWNNFWLLILKIFGFYFVDELPGRFDPHKYTGIDIMRLFSIADETVMENEEDQVNGMVHFVDGANVTFPFLTLFTPKEGFRMIKNAEVWLSYTSKLSIYWKFM
jgi:hypothetical protein